MPRRRAEITKRDAELVLLLVAPNKTAISEAVLARVRVRLSSAGVQHRILIATYEDLGMTVDDDLEREAEAKPAPEAS